MTGCCPPPSTGRGCPAGGAARRRRAGRWGTACLATCAPQDRQVQRRGRRDHHGVAEALALEHLVGGDERRPCRTPRGPRATTRATNRSPGSSARLSSATPDGRSTRRTSRRNSTVVSSAGHPATGVRIEHHDVGARVRQGRDPGQPVHRAHADAVPARQRQLAADHLGEGLVRLEHDLRRPRPLGVDVAGQRQPGATDVGDAQRARRQRVDDGGEVLDVLERQGARVAQVARATAVSRRASP